MNLGAVQARAACVLLGLSSSGCSSTMFRMTDGSNVKAYVTDSRGGPPGSSPDELRFKPTLCDGTDLRPDGRLLTETHLLEYLKRQNLDVRVERPRSDLVYLVVTGAGTNVPVRLRVALLKNADEAGVELTQAVFQHGQGSWGVLRSNLAVLGPIGTLEDDLTFAAKTKLNCWGTFMTAGRDQAYVVPGGYREL
jgi:hypothetical protein